jgi:hypothetical protein
MCASGWGLVIVRGDLSVQAEAGAGVAAAVDATFFVDDLPDVLPHAATTPQSRRARMTLRVLFTSFLLSVANHPKRLRDPPFFGSG